MLEGLWLAHPDDEMCAAFLHRFAGLPGVRIVQCRFGDLEPHDCFVTAGNAFGLMTAGIDAAVVRRYRLRSRTGPAPVGRRCLLGRHPATREGAAPPSCRTPTTPPEVETEGVLIAHVPRAGQRTLLDWTRATVLIPAAPARQEVFRDFRDIPGYNQRAVSRCSWTFYQAVGTDLEIAGG
jgi:hypothetical protein